MTERCYLLANDRETAYATGEEARTALVALGYGLVAEVDCGSGTITSQANPEYVAQGDAERELFDSLPEAEKHTRQRLVGGVQIEEAGQHVPWGTLKAKAPD
jgi:hypothetical protein